MSAAACIKFITPFSKEFLPNLDYLEHVYVNCNSKHTVSGVLFWVNGAWASGELAEIFECDLGDASTWNITRFDDTGGMKTASLYALFREDISQEVGILKTLLRTPGSVVLFDPKN